MTAGKQLDVSIREALESEHSSYAKYRVGQWDPIESNDTLGHRGEPTLRHPLTPLRSPLASRPGEHEHSATLMTALTTRCA